MLSLRLLFSNSYDPWFNLSLEEYIFKNMTKNQSILFLWRNQNTVVIGRAQNAWKECNTRRMARDSIRLARRCSGGGAVFHDLGNTCFTFMSTHKSYDNNVSFNIILNGLTELGINAFLSGRNDIVVNTKLGQRKVSGSAYRTMFDRKFHHGTLLLNVDLNKLTYYLNPDYKKLHTKGITSIRSRVTNLTEFNSNINHELVCEKLIESFVKYHKQTVIPEIFSKKNVFQIPGFSEQFDKQRCWDWNFGNAPAFQHQLDNRFHWGSVELFFNIENGVISNSCVFTDSLDPLPLEELSSRLIGVSYNTHCIQQCCLKWIQHWPKCQELQDVSSWLIQKIV